MTAGRPIGAATRGRVLIADDEAAICRALGVSLTRAGFTVLTASGGDAALGVLRGTRVDALVLDLRLPELRGDAVFQVAVAHQPHLRTQTLFITGDLSERAANLVRACGTPMLYKPFALADVIGTLSGMLESREAAEG